MLLELLFGTSAGLLTVFVISFMLCMGTWMAWLFLSKSKEPVEAPAPSKSAEQRTEL